MTEPLLNIHHKYTEFDQSWVYAYVRGWAGATHSFTNTNESYLIRVYIYDPFDHEERNEFYEQAWRIGHKPGDLLYEHWYVDVGIDTSFTMSYFDVDELQGMIDVLSPWQKICDSHNEVNKKFAQVVDY